MMQGRDGSAAEPGAVAISRLGDESSGRPEIMVPRWAWGVFAVLVFLRVPESPPEVLVSAEERPGSMAAILGLGDFMTNELLTFCFAVVFMQHLSSLPVQLGDDRHSP